MSKCILAVAVMSVALSTAAAERIVGGEPAPEGAYPFFSTVVQEGGEHICGAALIAPQWVITAAHCIRGPQPHSVEVGITRYRPSVSLDKVPIAEAYIPKDFKSWANYSKTAKNDRSSGQYDIALLKLVRPARSNQFLSLDIERKEEPGDPVTLAGFGRIEGNLLPDVLFHGNGQILDTNRCIEVPEGYPDTNFDPALNICGPGLARGGDSGGPLLSRKENGEYVGLGLVSRGLIDSGQFTRISFFQGWMNIVMHSARCEHDEKQGGKVPICASIAVPKT